MLHYFQSLFISIRFCEINLQIASIRCKPWQKYYPKHAVAVAECHEYGCYKYIVAKSTPQYGYHAEEIEIRYLARTRQLYVEAIYITYSPCTILLLGAFPHCYRKPFKFLCVYETRKQTIWSLKLLIQDGFTIDAWDITGERNSAYCLIEPNEEEESRMEMQLKECQTLNVFRQRVKKIRSMIKMKLHEPSFSVDIQIRVFTLQISIPNYAMFARPSPTGKQITIHTSGTATCSKLCHRY